MTDNYVKNPIVFNMSALLDRTTREHQAGQPQTMPVQITKMDKSFVYAGFQAQNGIYTTPAMRMSQAYSKYAREPTQVGDFGYAVPADLYMGGVDNYGDGTANYRSRGNLSTLVFHPVSTEKFPDNVDYNQYTLTGGPNGVMIRSADTYTTIEIKPDGSIKITDKKGHYVWMKTGYVCVNTQGDDLFLGGDPGNGDSFSKVVTEAGPSVNVQAKI